MENFIPVNEPLMDGNEKKYLCECIDTGWISSEGPFVERFEKGLAGFAGRKYGIAVSSGTAALEAALQALRLPPGMEVILPAFTIISCAQAIVKAGLTPVVVDCREDTWNLNVEELEDKITGRTAAIMVVHIYGLTVDMAPVLRLACKYGLKVIEDAAQAHGQTCDGKNCGSFGDISVFSFYPNKHITTGEGGMILTDDEELAERCRSIRNLCFQRERRFIHDEIGNNFRMTNLQAALGVAQLERIEETVGKKRWIGSYYSRAFGDLPESIKQPLAKTDYCENIYWVYGMVLAEELHKNAVWAMEELKKQGIGTRPFFYPIHKQPVFLKMGLFFGVKCPVAENLAERGFYIPSGLGLTEDKIKSVIAAVYRVLGTEGGNR